MASHDILAPAPDDKSIPAALEALREIKRQGTKNGDPFIHADAFCDALGLAEKLYQAVDKIDHTLRVPAAEYVPAIGDVFTIIDGLKNELNSDIKST